MSIGEIDIFEKGKNKYNKYKITFEFVIIIINFKLWWMLLLVEEKKTNLQ